MRVTKIAPLGGAGLRVDLQFEGSAADPVLRDPNFQRELRQIEEKIRREDVGVRSQVGLQKSVEGGSWLTGAFGAVFGAIGPLGVILVAWLQGRAGRKVKLKIADTEAEARTPEEVERLLAIARAYRNGYEGSDQE